jgi:multiple sugar transport system permease protein
MGKRVTWGKVLSVIILTIVMITVLYPFLWLVFSTIKPETELMAYPPTFFPQEFTFSHYTHVWESIPLLNLIKNTIIFALGVALFSLLFDSMAAYAFARIRFKGSKWIFAAILITMMIPFQVIMIPLFVEVFKLGMLNTYWGLILPRASSAFGIFMMRSFFISLPKELEESGRVDGFNEFQIYWKIMLPLCGPALITLGIFHFMGNWNDLLYPLMLTSSTEMRTLPSGLAMFVGRNTIEYGPTLAAATISFLPLLVLFTVAQKYFVQGVATSGLKG